MTTAIDTKVQAKKLAQDLLDFIDASPSPWHAVNSVEQRLLAQGFTALPETDNWQLESGGSYFVTRGGASIIAFTLGSQSLTESGFHMYRQANKGQWIFPTLQGRSTHFGWLPCRRKRRPPRPHKKS